VSISWSLPAALVLLLAIPPYLWWIRRASGVLPLPRGSSLRGASRAGPLLGAVPPLLRSTSLVALVLAIAGPTTAGAVVEERREGIPIVVAIDISSSMLAQDFAPRDRLQVAKSTTARFIEGRSDDPIGIVAFAGEALTLVPVTMHHAVVLNALAGLGIGLLEDGTAIGDGLAAAVNRLRYQQAGDGVVVLLSDGENNRGIDPLEAAAAAVELGIQVFTIGVGSEGVARVPVGAAPEGFRYAELPVGIDEDLLREIAGRTGGQYFRALDPQALERIFGEIDGLVPSVVETTRHVRTVGWAGLLLLIAGLALGTEWSVRGSRWGALP
jgi:Ca-activated chloride channel homolog